MANAAAKKSVAARSSAGQTYLPIFLGVNILFLLIKFAFSSSTYTIWSYVGILLLLGLNWFCYKSILESAATSKTSTDLVGGAWLDVVAVVWLIQAGTALWSPKAYYLLPGLPLWGAYKLYKTFKGSMPQSSAAQETPAPVSEESQERRQKRAERRQRKRA